MKEVVQMYKIGDKVRYKEKTVEVIDIIKYKNKNGRVFIQYEVINDFYANTESSFLVDEWELEELFEDEVNEDW